MLGDINHHPVSLYLPFQFHHNPGHTYAVMSEFLSWGGLMGYIDIHLLSLLITFYFIITHVTCIMWWWSLCLGVVCWVILLLIRYLCVFLFGLVIIFLFFVLFYMFSQESSIARFHVIIFEHYFTLPNLFWCIFDRVQDSYEEQEFWMTRLDWFGIQLNQFEMFEEHENYLSRWKQCCYSWKLYWMKTMYK